MKKEKLPALGTGLSELNEMKTKLNSMFYIIGSALALMAYVILIDSALFDQKAYKAIKMVIYVIIICLILQVAFLAFLFSDEKKLFDECTDADVLNKVVAAAKEFPEVAQQLQECLKAEGRKYLCWFEVFRLLETADKESKSKVLNAAKLKINQFQS
jgi:hypothetical protein